MRDATAEAHAALDAAVGGFGDRESYAAYLRANLRFRATVEPALKGVAFSPWRPRLLLDDLRRDMTDLGLPLPDPTPAPSLSGSALIGRLYVLEGAALGSQILRKRAQTLGFDATFGARHLSGTVANWTAFLSVLDMAEPFDADQAVVGATLTFDLARDAFAKEPT
ncbi:biliverdin-producing heme oxygenase [Falsirhodobacter sp. 20TX0035]|uniref:biliverdin-producing heme oxygenase n=1 Tax=Falsirhodobacter sp. 20TX0035 TaxID=3022019 RepID=UPI00232E1B16|nr:biliverdin-producing heme oxygenase [Falsirhodobacter sp. 20TX0035]MDB6453226.1 biliverdin-producing heme oxygenase [Falsirhodobacter sp. 20TX0035]